MSKTLTVFTPTYNRAHLLRRVYESLVTQTSDDFEWLVVDDGSKDFTQELVRELMAENRIPIRYIYKDNGGLHTAYNTAYANIDSELCVCIDSDDFMPERAVETIINTWRERGSERYAGLIGLDLRISDMQPIGGLFPSGMNEVYFPDLRIRKLHIGDTKPVTVTKLMRQVAPQIGYEGEKHFNPVYMLLQVTDTMPMIVINEPLCIVDYQTGGDSMSAGIFRQYVDSPRSFAKLRRLELSLNRGTLRNSLRCAVHYVACSHIASDGDWLRESPCKALTLLAAPAGWLLSYYIRYRASKC